MIAANDERKISETLLRVLRVISLQRLGSIIGMASFAGYQLWDLLLDPQAFPKTAPIRLSIMTLSLLGWLFVLADTAQAA